MRVFIQGGQFNLSALLKVTRTIQLRIVHRDLALRNVLVSKGNKTKLGDFGLARKIPEGKDHYTILTQGKLPMRSMAIETLMSNKFTLMADVWSFGVTMWEMMT